MCDRRRRTELSLILPVNSVKGARSTLSVFRSGHQAVSPHRGQAVEVLLTRVGMAVWPVPHAMRAAGWLGASTACTVKLACETPMLNFRLWKAGVMRTSVWVPQSSSRIIYTKSDFIPSTNDLLRSFYFCFFQGRLDGFGTAVLEPLFLAYSFL